MIGTNISKGQIQWFKLSGDYADYGSVGATATNSGSYPAIIEDSIATVLKDNYTAISGQYLIWTGKGGQMGTVHIEN